MMERSMRLIAVLVVLLVGSLARAQPGMTPPTTAQPPPTPTTAHPPPLSTKTPVIGPKSQYIAMGLSIGIPVAGALTMALAPKDGQKALGFFAMYLGPTTGLWYANKGGGLGLGLRLLSIAAAVGAFMLVVDEECDLDTDCEATANDYVAGTIAVGAAGLWVGSSIYDVVLARRAVAQWNQKLTLTPGLIGNGSQRAPGLFIGGRF